MSWQAYEAAKRAWISTQRPCAPLQNSTGSDMSFHPASNGLIPLREKQIHPLPADVIFTGA